jgi:hypothetical protein
LAPEAALLSQLFVMDADAGQIRQIDHTGEKDTPRS